MLISIFASIWSQNLWDELILKNEIGILRDRYKDKKPRFIVFTYDIENPFYLSDDIDYREYFPIWSKESKNIFRNIKNFFVFLWIVLISNLIIIGWWWIIYDTEKQTTKSPLDQWIFRTNIFRFFLKKFSFFWVGISLKDVKWWILSENLIKESTSLQKVRKIFSWAYSIELRDEYSKSLLDNLHIDSKVILDPVFRDFWEAVVKKELCLKKLDSKDFSLSDLADIDFEWKKVGVAFRKGYISKTSNPEMEILIIKEILDYIKKKGWEVILLPHSFHKRDILANDYQWMKLIMEKVKDLSITHSMQETYEVYKDKKIDICLSQRFHSIVLSNVYDIQFIAFSYGRKTKELLKEF